MRPFATPVLAAIFLAMCHVPGLARDVRVATFNVQDIGTIGTPEYIAASNILRRIDADVVAFQELRSAETADWLALAAALGYDHTVFGAYGPFSGGLYLGYFSRFPITSSFNVDSPQNCGGTTVKELTRLPFRAVIDVPGAEHPLVLWDLHLKASTGMDDEFRRAVESLRTADDMDGYLAANPSDQEFIVLGDLNEDVSESQTSEITSLPSGLPASFQLGCDITYPISYDVFPQDAFEVAGSGMHMTDAYQEDTANDGTLIASGRRVDYIFVSNNLWTSPLGTPEAEIYNSDQDDGVGGLPKYGAPLPAGTSSAASDHYAVFIDIHMEDKAVTTIPVGAVFLNGHNTHVAFDSTISALYTVEYCEDLAASNSWSAVSDFVDVPGSGGVMMYTDDGTGTPSHPSAVDFRFYRVTRQ